MPKKIATNSKAVEARERKQATKLATVERAAKEAEDRLWQDDDKSLAKKQQRKEEEDRKRAEAARRKAEAKVLLDQEMSSIRTQGKQPLAKINRQQVLEELEKKQRAMEANNAANKPTSKVVLPEPVLEENLNRAMADTMIATNVEQALAVLTVKDDDDDKHPEKRMRAAYRAFETANLPRIKAENPSLRMSQWKQMIMKEWNKSPENPFNQAR